MIRIGRIVCAKQNKVRYPMSRGSVSARPQQGKDSRRYRRTQSNLANPALSIHRLRPSTVLEETPVSEKREYQHAKEVVPHIVATETSLVYFLRVENFNAINAARRLLFYWKWRKESFGERWLLPMTQTGTGALNRLDILLLRTGFCFAVPAANGGRAFIINFAKAKSFFVECAAQGYNSAEYVARIAIYTVTVQADELSRAKDVLLFHPLSAQDQTEVPEFRAPLWDMIRRALPVVFTRAVVAQAHEEGKQSLLDFVRFGVAKVVEFNTGFKPTEVHADSVARTVGLLEQNGMVRDSIPLRLGGSLNYDAKVAEWTRMRVSMEDLMGPIQPVMSAVPCETIVNAAGARRKANFLIKRKRDAPDGAVTEEAFCKKRNALYSRRMYHKRKLELFSLQEKVKVWESRNQAVQEDNQRLESLLLRAKALVDPTVDHAQALAPVETMYDSTSVLFENGTGFSSKQSPAALIQALGSNFGGNATQMAAYATAAQPYAHPESEWGFGDSDSSIDYIF